MDGYITIGTKLDTKELEKGLKKAENELVKFKNDREKMLDQRLKIEADIELKGKEFENKLAEIKEKTKIDMEVNTEHGYLQSHIEQKIKAEEQLKINALQNRYNQQMEIADNKITSLNKKLKANAVSQVETNNKIKEMNSELTKTRGFDNMKNSANNLRDSMKDIVKSAVQWGLAIFGVRAVYGFIRNSISTISQYNSQIGTDIEYIRFALASTLEPVIIRIIQLVYKLLYYIGYIAKAWFGVNIFAGASADRFAKAKDSSGGVAKNVGKAAKNAKELNKQLAGFDEMNILQDNSNKDSDTGGGGGGGGAGGINTPSFDLSKFEGKIPDWIKWIADHKDEIIAAILGIAGALTAFKLGLSAPKAVGVGLIIAGLVYAIEGLLKYLKDPSLQNLGKFIEGIGVAIIGLGIVVGSVTLGIIGAVILVVGAIVKYWDQIKAGLEKASDFLHGKAKDVGGIFGFILEMLGTWIDNIKEALGNIVQGVKDIVDGVIKIVKGFLEGDMEKVKEGIAQLLTGIIELVAGLIQLGLAGVKALISTTIEAIKKIVGAIVTWIKDKIITPIKNFFSNLWKGIKDGAKAGVDGIKNFFKGIPDWFNNLISKIKSKFSSMGSKIGNAIGNAFKSAINKVLGAIEKILNTPINAINKLIGAVNKLPKVHMDKISTFSLPRLAKGGIVNLPGSGVPVGSAVAGERGAEGVIPLTDSQQMMLLGEAIGKYITINANITNTMNGRVISRELKQIQNDNDFAYNR